MHICDNFMSKQTSASGSAAKLFFERQTKKKRSNDAALEDGAGDVER